MCLYAGGLHGTFHLRAAVEHGPHLLLAATAQPPSRWAPAERTHASAPMRACQLIGTKEQDFNTCRAGACTTARTAPPATSAGRRRRRSRPSAPHAPSTSAPSERPQPCRPPADRQPPALQTAPKVDRQPPASQPDPSPADSPEAGVVVCQSRGCCVAGASLAGSWGAAC